MAFIGRQGVQEVREVIDRLKAGVRPDDCLEDVAQALCSTLYTRYTGAVALVRVFLSAPGEELPEAVQRSAAALARAKGEPALARGSRVLALAGTRGAREEWNDRRRSRGHAAIPLVSPAFVDAIPMISQLLKQLGLHVEGRLPGPSSDPWGASPASSTSTTPGPPWTTGAGSSSPRRTSWPKTVW
jgi:hypothetical protein